MEKRKLKAEKEVADKLAAKQKEEERVSVDPVASGEFGNLTYWEPEYDVFWKNWGWKVALPNTLVSIYNLMLLFATWKQWGSVIAGIKAAHAVDPNNYAFGYGEGEGADWKMALGTLGGISGMSGAIHRVVHSFMPGACGGRTTNFMICVCNALNMLILSVIISRRDCPYYLLLLVSIGTGIGGGAFSSMMGNISYFFPTRFQGAALGIVGGFGNLGIFVAKIMYETFGGTGMCFGGPSGECNTPDIGGTYLFSVPILLTVMSLIGMYLSWKYLHNMPDHGVGSAVKRPNSSNIFRFLIMQGLAFGLSVMCAVLFVVFNPVIRENAEVNMVRGFILASVSIPLALAGLYFSSSFLPMGDNIRETFVMFRSWDTLYLSLLYIMTFSSFLGYLGNYGKVIKKIFPGNLVSDYTWMGASCGCLARICAGFVADRYTGSFSTAGVTASMIVTTFILGGIIRSSMGSPDPQSNFGFFIFFSAIMFLTLGAGNATVFKLIAARTPVKTRGAVLGWTAAMAAYGGSILPTFFLAGANQQLDDIVYYLIAIYFASCFLIVWRYMYWLGPNPA